MLAVTSAPESLEALAVSVLESAGGDELPPPPPQPSASTALNAQATATHGRRRASFRGTGVRCHADTGIPRPDYSSGRRDDATATRYVTLLEKSSGTGLPSDLPGSRVPGDLGEKGTRQDRG